MSFGTPFIAAWKGETPFYWLFQMVLVGLSFLTSSLFLPESKYLREPNNWEDLTEQEKTVFMKKVQF